MLHLQRPPASSEIIAPRPSSLLNGHDTDTDIDRVYNEIFDAVMDRRLMPGAKLTEARLCRIFLCSRATVRGALARLAHDKIVTLQPHRGAFVWRPDRKETQDVFELRRAIECVVVDKLLSMPDLDAHLEPLYAMVEHEKAAFEHGDRVSWIRLSNAFHVRMAAVAGNDVLTELMHSLCARSTIIIAHHDTPAEQTCSYVEHRHILDLLAARQRDAALDAMHHHLQDCEHRMQETDGRQPDPWLAFGAGL
ncbi:GntR family transcriptional regulator [Pollutimonas thiosulfatoxidans]|uniref:GntR family transcriptional regulator n=1 Tax=Pollutimonas thiosulfatoxidans TaxID=2028345 RepID=A0A410GBB7_9BURK|nr:GntR family transcriptional regulator [Pollutimonas thiosulfatoxidans]NYT46225.1 GntR family transcriptional regulator [Alcaligenaceae bacterium]QAA93590.1 GntR family transcriptional regulator [Pollutimonas thiosulfatoxidans]